LPGTSRPAKEASGQRFAHRLLDEKSTHSDADPGEHVVHEHVVGVILSDEVAYEHALPWRARIAAPCPRAPPLHHGRTSRSHRAGANSTSYSHPLDLILRLLLLLGTLLLALLANDLGLRCNRRLNLVEHLAEMSGGRSRAEVAFSIR
jgi:hypothetical protein